MPERYVKSTGAQTSEDNQRIQRFAYHPEMIRNVMRGMQRRAAFCVERNGDMLKGTAHSLNIHSIICC